MAVLRIMDKIKGDVAVEWDVADADSVKAAETAFINARKAGRLVYRVNPDGGISGDGQVVDRFNPEDQILIAIPPMAGG